MKTTALMYANGIYTSMAYNKNGRHILLRCPNIQRLSCLACGVPDSESSHRQISIWWRRPAEAVPQPIADGPHAARRRAARTELRRESTNIPRRRERAAVSSTPEKIAGYPWPFLQSQKQQHEVRPQSSGRVGEGRKHTRPDRSLRCGLERLVP